MEEKFEDVKFYGCKVFSLLQENCSNYGYSQSSNLANFYRIFDTTAYKSTSFLQFMVTFKFQLFYKGTEFTTFLKKSIFTVLLLHHSVKLCIISQNYNWSVNKKYCCSSRSSCILVSFTVSCPRICLEQQVSLKLIIQFPTSGLTLIPKEIPFYIKVVLNENQIAYTESNVSNL